jgi:hypothetical protein
LIETVTPAAGLDEAVGTWTTAILDAGPRAIRLQKALMRRWETVHIDAAIEAGVDAFREAHRGDEPRVRLHEVLARRGGRA